MYKCNHCKLEIPDNQAEGRIVKVGPKDNPKCYCMECGEPVVYIPDIRQATGGLHGAQATLISNSDNRITTNNYYGNGTPDEQIDTPYGPCRKSEARLCRQCRQWIPLAFFNMEKNLCDNCIEHEGTKAYEEGKLFFEMELYDEALKEFIKFEPFPKNAKDLANLQYYIGRCYYEQKQWKDALRYFVKSHENSADSLFYMGLCFKSGYGVPKDEKKGAEYIKRASQKKNRSAADFITAEELKMKKKEENKRKIEELVNQARTEFLKNNREAAMQLFNHAKEMGYIFTDNEINMIGDICCYKKDYSEAFRMYKKAAEHGCSDAQINLGYLYEHGKGIAKDMKEAIKWYKKAAEQNNVEAMRLLSIYYGDYYYNEAKKHYEIRNSEEANKWDRKGAELGYWRCQWNYGKRMGNDLFWLRKAAEQCDDPSVINALGEICQMNETRKIESERNYSEALKWYRKAAEQGNHDAQNNLGDMYKYGYGVPVNKDEANKWYAKARLTKADWQIR